MEGMGGVAESGVATTVDVGDKGDDEAPGDWKEGDSRITLWNAGECEEFDGMGIPDTVAPLGGLKDGDSTIIPGI